MSINPKMWDEDDFVPMSVESKLFWCHLISGYTGGIPGLILGGVSAFADAMRYEHDVIESCLKELSDAKYIEYDKGRRLLRIPSGPRYKKPGNKNVLKGWLRRWKDFPESPLKYRHLKSLYQSGEGRYDKWFNDGWDETFELISGGYSRHMPNGAIVAFENKQGLTGDVNETKEIERSESCGNDLVMVSQSLPPLNVTAPATVTETETSTETTTVSHDVYQRLANEIWQEQEDMCAEIRSGGAGGRALGLMNRAKIDLVYLISERVACGGTIPSVAEDCRHVLAVLGAEAKELKSTKWIDGGHWKESRFNAALSRSIEDVKPKEDVTVGRVEPMEYEDYDKPGMKEW